MSKVGTQTNTRDSRDLLLEDSSCQRREGIGVGEIQSSEGVILFSRIRISERYGPQARHKHKLVCVEHSLLHE